MWTPSLSAFARSLAAVVFVAATLVTHPPSLHAQTRPTGVRSLESVLPEEMRGGLPMDAGDGGSQRPSLDGALLPDGRVRPDAAGSFSGDGYAMSLGADGTPHFAPLPGDRPAIASGLSSADGSFSRAFSYNAATNIIYAITVAANGDVYVGGDFVNLGGIDDADHVARWDGTSWNSVGGGTGGRVRCIAVSGSDVYVGGGFSTVHNSNRSTSISTRGIARWNSSTGTWSSLGSGTGSEATSQVYAIAVGGSDVYVGGTFTTVLDTDGTAVGNTTRLARWSSTDNTWNAVGGGIDTGYSRVNALALMGSDLYVGGEFPSVRRSDGTAVVATKGIARWRLSTGTWSSVGNGVNGNVYAFAVNGSDLYVGGAFPNVTGTDGTAIGQTGVLARWNEASGSWHGLATPRTSAPSDPAVVYTLAINGTDLYVGGRFSFVPTTDGTAMSGRWGAARWNTESHSWAPMGGGTYGKLGGAGTVYAMAVHGADVFVGGDFEYSINSGDAYVAGTSYLSRWNGTVWGPWPTPGRGANGTVHAIVASETGDIYVGGTFVDLGGVPGATGVARWDGTAWRALGYGTNMRDFAGQGVRALAVHGNKVYAGGLFTHVVNPSGLGVSYTANVAAWDTKNNTWEPLGRGTPYFFPVMALAVQGSDVYVGGQFPNVFSSDGTALGATRGIARWNAERNSWSGVGGGTGGVNGSGSVYTLAVSGSDVYAGGYFDYVYNLDGNSVPYTNRVARWNTNDNDWSPLGAGVGDGYGGGIVYAIAVDGPNVYVGGSLSRAYYSDGRFVDGTRSVFRWNAQTGIWSPLGGSMNTNGILFIYALHMHGSDLYVGGDFPTVYTRDGVAVDGARNVARWNEASGTWSPIGRGVNATVFALASAPPIDGVGAGSVLYLGGDFTSASGIPASRLTYYTDNIGVSVDAPSRAGTLTLGVRGNGSRAPRVVLSGVAPGVLADVTVFDMLGRRIRAVSGVSEGDIPMDLSSLARGVYVVRVVAEAQVATASVVVR